MYDVHGILSRNKIIAGAGISSGLKGLRRRPIFPARFQASIFGSVQLNFCVRNGNRWILHDMITGNFISFPSLHPHYCITPSKSFLDQALDLLVSVSSMHYCTSTSDLSPCCLQGVLLFSDGKSYLGGGFTLRCFQRLSRPHFATRLCPWQNNRYTSGASIPVLSY